MPLTMHIGHDKTGSSAIQSALAGNTGLLAEYGITYPQDPTIYDAAKGYISSGNRSVFLDTTTGSISDDLLFSGEAFVKDIIAKNDIWSRMVELKGEIDRVIIYTRNLFGHFFSQWGQSIKRGGGSRLPSGYAQNYNVYPNILSVIHSLEEIGIRVFV